LSSLKLPDEPFSAEKLYENKMFNPVKAKMPHLPTKGILDLIAAKWRNGITEQERQEFNDLA
jgi:hypothetical protein